MNSRLLPIKHLLLLTALSGLSWNSSAKQHTYRDRHDSVNVDEALFYLPHTNDRTMLAQSKKGISKSQAASAAQRKYGGKVINVSQQGNSYRVKLLLDSGKVKIVTVDASTGKAR